MDVDDPRADFAPILSERRGHRDLALLFDPRRIAHAEFDGFLRTALALAGPTVEGAWICCGTMPARFVWNEARSCPEHVMLSRPLDFPDAPDAFVVAELEDIAPQDVMNGLQRLEAHAAFVGAVELVGASEFRTQLSCSLAWVD